MSATISALNQYYSKQNRTVAKGEWLNFTDPSNEE